MSHAHRHGWRVLRGGTEKRGLKHTFSLQSWSNAQLALRTTTTVVIDVNMLRLWLYRVVNGALPLTSSKYYYSQQQPSDVSRVRGTGKKRDLRSRSERSGGSFHSAPRHPSGSQEDC